MSTFTPIQGEITLTGQAGAQLSFTAIQGEIVLSGMAVPQFIFVSGNRFASLPDILAYATPLNSVTGGSFISNAGILGGANVVGTSISAAPTIAVAVTDTAYVAGRGFGSVPTIAFISASNSAVTGRGFSSSVTINGGAVVVGKGFRSSLTATVKAPEHIGVIGRGFSTDPAIVGEGSTGFNITGRGFASSLYYSRVVGSGFSSQLIASVNIPVSYSDAVVMNLRSNQVSRYQNFPFFHLARIGDTYFGVSAGGLYELSGDMDIETQVNGLAWGKAFDFGVFNSKNVPYMYMNGDDVYTVSAYVDASEQPEFTSAFSGRRVKLARGNKGRYWSFKVEGIKKLQGIEYMPDNISRRVK